MSRYIRGYTCITLIGPRQAKTCLRPCAKYADSDHPVYSKSIIRAFTRHTRFLSYWIKKSAEHFGIVSLFSPIGDNLHLNVFHYYNQNRAGFHKRTEYLRNGPSPSSFPDVACGVVIPTQIPVSILYKSIAGLYR